MVALLVPAGAGGAEPNWRRVGSYQPPTIRCGTMMARDQSGRTMLFGGATPNVVATNNETWRFDGDRWRLLNPELSPPPRAYAMAAYDAAHEEVVLFGGATNDTWTWDGADWKQETPLLSPPARVGGAMAYDYATQKVILFGGASAIVGGVSFNDTWTWDGSEWGLQTPLLSPPPRHSFGLSDGGANSKPVLFGGLAYVPGTGVVLGDTWMWDGPNHTWAAALNPGPAARAGASLSLDPTSGKTLLFGGYTKSVTPSQQEFADTWAWDGNSWTLLAPISSPRGRWCSGMAFDSVDQRTRLFGGLANWGYSNDTWAWDGTTWIREDVTAPNELQNSMFAREPLLNPEAEALQATSVLFSGQTEYGHDSTETWRWDGTDWEMLLPQHSPLPRQAGSMVFDAARNRTVLFGGLIDTLGLPGPREVYAASDTWTWDGFDWTQLEPAISPPPRYYSSIAYDSARAQVVVFGGKPWGSTTIQNDTWVWDGETWTERHPLNSPPSRFAAAMTYDPVRAQVVLFGGSTSTNAALSDTWVWDGENWNEVLSPPGSSPSGRAYGAMAFDPSTSSAILFGGCNTCFGATFDQSWSWDGGRWTLLNPTQTPYRRTNASAISGDDSGPMLLFGGRRPPATLYPEGTELMNDLWEFGS